VAESAKVTGLRPHTSYHYVLVLSTAGGPIDGRAINFKTLTYPTGSTGRATGVTASRATLHGTVDAQGAPVIACLLEYGLRKHGRAGLTYRHAKRCVPMPTGSRRVAVRALLTSLRAGTAYVFRVVLTTDAGTLVATTRSFATKRVPGVRITDSRIAGPRRTASFSFRAVHTHATRYRCALVSVHRRARGRWRFRGCHSPTTYAGLRAGTYEFAVEAGNRFGYGPAATRRFRIR
jgi:hypothetical protein